MPDKKVVTRFAPSPTGFIHAGNVRTALYAWLWARKNNGTFILRIEDTDKKREVADSIDHIKKTLKWLGLDWDEGPDMGESFPRFFNFFFRKHAPYIQSKRLKKLNIYKKYAEKLIGKGFAYADSSSEEKIEELRKQAGADKKAFLFRDHRPKNPPEWKTGIPLRFKIKEPKRTTWHDAVWGELSAGPEALDDFILIKSDGYPTYNFAHIVDDIEMGVTHVIRGQEFISSAPNYIAVYEALETKEPVYVTVPPIMGAEGTKKMGKREGAKDTLEYKREGYLPEAMFNFLAFLGWNPGGEKEIMTREEIINLFDIDKIQKSGAQFNEEKLDWINKEHIKRLTDTEFIKKAKSFIDPKIIITKNLTDTELDNYILLFRDRIIKFGELNNLMQDIIVDEKIATILNDYLLPQKDPTLRGAGLLMPKELKGNSETVIKYLTEVRRLIEESNWEKILQKNDENKLWVYSGLEGRGRVLLPIRVALSGKEKSLDLFAIMKAIGKEATLRRIENAIERLKIPEEELNTETKNNVSTISDPFTIKK
jgi:glutamyl-tRNA synthetase